MTSTIRLFAFFVFLVGCTLGTGCSATIPNRNPVGEAFPSVVGNSLDDKPYRLPEDLAGQPAILLVGTVQNAQFDLDRWLYGILLAKPAVRVFEVPAVRGLAAGLASSAIDSGMRSGIPREEWGTVVTVYHDAEKIVDFTGNEGPRNARVFLLDSEGKVHWFHDRGYSASKMIDLQKAAQELTPPAR